MGKYYHIIIEQARKKDLLPKLVCIFLAVILWAYISKTQNGDIKFKVPVTVKGLSQSYAISRMSDVNLTVKFKGTSEELKNTSLKNLKLYVDVSKAVLGKYHSYKVSYTRNQIPEDVDIDLSSESIKILVEKKVYKKVKVIAVHDENQAGNHVIGKVTVSPEFVTVSGPESFVNTVLELKTEELLLGNSSKTVEESVKISKDFKYSEYIDINPSEVTVRVPVIPESDIKEETLNIDVTNKVDAYSYELLIKQIRVRYIFDKKNDGDLKYSASVNVSGIAGLKKGVEAEKSLRVNLSSESDPFLKRVLLLDPDVVKVKIIDSE